MTADWGDLARTVLKSPDFGTIEQRLRLVPREHTASLATDSPNMAVIGASQALSWVLMVLGIILVLAIIIVIIRKTYAQAIPPPSKKNGKWVSIDQSHTTQNSSTEEISGHWRDLCIAMWESGEKENALGLLYRVCLSALRFQVKINFPDSATESECLRLAQTSLQPEDRRLQTLSGLVYQRVLLSYGHREPAIDTFLTLVDDLKAWASGERQT